MPGPYSGLIFELPTPQDSAPLSNDIHQSSTYENVLSAWVVPRTAAAVWPGRPLGEPEESGLPPIV
jgi:hypothetical protein